MLAPDGIDDPAAIDAVRRRSTPKRCRGALKSAIQKPSLTFFFGDADHGIASWSEMISTQTAT
jgi:hypothetical protein